MYTVGHRHKHETGHQYEGRGSGKKAGIHHTSAKEIHEKLLNLSDVI